MKRAFLKKVKPISCTRYSSNPDFPSPDSSNAESRGSEQTQSGARRRIRTSAAMVGLALSMGTTGLIVPRHGDGASAAESNENSASTLQPAAQVAALSPDRYELITTPPPSFNPTSEPSEHVVIQGQTLQQIAQRYQISVEALAAINRILPTDALKPGQVLRVPESAAGSAGGVMQSPQMIALAELSRLPTPDFAANQLQARDQALGRLMQEQSKLKERLAALRRGDSSVGPMAQRIEDTSNKQLPSPLPSPASQVAHTVALTPAGSAPDLDWMRASRSLAIPSTQSGAAAFSPAAGSTGSTEGSRSQPQVKPTATLPGAIISGALPAAPVTTAMGLGAASGHSYQVSLGDTVARIARTHSISPSALISANQLSNPNVIFVGQVLKVPAAHAEGGALPTVLPTSLVPRMGGTALPAVPAQVQQNQARQSQPTQLAVVPSTIPSSIPAAALNLPAANNQPASNPYVQNLLSEVKALREQGLVRSGAVSQPAPQTVAAASPSQMASLTPSAGSALPVNRPTIPRAQRQQSPTVVAVAPLNPESYAPLTEQIPGRLVSPDLPALPGADHFLPDGKLTGYLWPAKGMLTSGYGWRWGRMHAGIDIAADVGTPIHAAASGVVQYAGWNSGGYGNMVEIKHADGSMTRYGHMNAVYVQNGQRVSQSEQIGEMGSTGYSTGPHLHFEVHPVASGGAVNPMAYLPAQ